MYALSVHWIVTWNCNKAYLSPELCIDVIGCEASDRPQFSNRAEITRRHHQAYYTVPGTDE